MTDDNKKSPVELDGNSVFWKWKPECTGHSDWLLGKVLLFSSSVQFNLHTEETGNNLGLGLCMKKAISKATPDAYQGKGGVSKCSGATFHLRNNPILFARVEKKKEPIKNIVQCVTGIITIVSIL